MFFTGANVGILGNPSIRVPQIECQNDRMNPGGVVADLQPNLRGSVVMSPDPRYDDARMVFNALVDRRPAVVVQPADAADVRTALEYAQAKALPVSVRGGGHSVAGHSVGDDALALDLRPLFHVRVDPRSLTVTAGGGATWRDVDPACQLHGLALPGGTFDATGIGGLTLGGGIGYLLGAYGLTLDNLVSAHVVTPGEGSLVASADEHPDLFWALRGGGGNFGVVTAFVYRLHPVTTVFGGLIRYPLPVAAAALRAFKSVMEEAPDGLTVMVDLDASGAKVYVCCVDGGKAPRALLERHFGRLTPVRETLGELPYLTVQRLTGELRFGLRHYWKGHFLRDLPDELIDLAVEHIAQPDARASSILFEPMHGAVVRVPDEATAFAQRQARFNVTALGIWSDPADDDAVIRWGRWFASALEPHSASGGGYLNYGAPDESLSRVEAAYGSARFQRLSEIKRLYDPGNLLRFNHNIPPAGGA